MGIGTDEEREFHSACRALTKAGKVLLGSGNTLTLPPPPGRLTGTYRGNQRGFGFIVPDTPTSHGDLYIPRGAAGGAITGDTVAARVLKRGKRDGKLVYEGRITAILERGQSRFVGELQHDFGQWLVIPDGNTLNVPITIGDPRAKGAKPGDQVAVEIIEYPAAQRSATGAIVAVLGRSGEPDADTRSIIEQYGFAGEFEEAVLQSAREVVAAYRPQLSAKDREDLRKLTVITIDPVDARDFDDAISLTKHSEGTIELGVHIADVAHFVKRGGAVDREARERGNTVYLPRVAIPMLPEVLSNGVCSLQERQPRLTKSVFITYDRRGRVKHSRFANTIIRSSKRLTYEQVELILGGKKGRTSAKVVALLMDAQTLARRIRTRRIHEGMLVLDLPEVDLVHDEEGNVVAVKLSDSGFSHTLIEMFMVEANEAVARLLAKQKVPYLRRIHEAGAEAMDGSLQRFLKILGYDLPQRVDRSTLQALLDRTRGKPESFAVHLAVLRSMQRAEYSLALLGHYGLGSEHYCHFTSPIRRYPDLTIHRLIDQYIHGGLACPTTVEQVPGDEELGKLGAQCSATERQAEAAERELRLVLILRLLHRQRNDVLDGIVTGVANAGVFVQLERYLIDGLLPFEQLGNDRWEIDPSRVAAVAKRSGRQITVGDRLKVLVARINVPTRKLELALAEPIGEIDRTRRRKTSPRTNVRRASPRIPPKRRGSARQKRSR